MTEAAERVHALVELTAPDLLAYFQRRVGVQADAADLVSETLLVLWRRRADLPDDDIEARMWMFGVARRVRLQWQRGGVRRSALADRLRDELAIAAPASADPRVDALREAIAELPERDREIMRLVAWDGFSLAEVAEHLRVPAGTVRSRYSRARATLRARLED